jgi:hypothetical protein
MQHAHFVRAFYAVNLGEVVYNLAQREGMGLFEYIWYQGNKSFHYVDRTSYSFVQSQGLTKSGLYLGLALLVIYGLKIANHKLANSSRNFSDCRRNLISRFLKKINITWSPGTIIFTVASSYELITSIIKVIKPLLP